MAPKAVFTGREIGASTARALTLRMVGGVVLMFFLSSFDTVPSYKAWRGPSRHGRFHQPAPGIFGGESDALCLTGFDGEGVKPKRLPAVVETVQQPEMMAVEVKHGRRIGAIGQRQDDRAASFGAESGRNGAYEARWCHPLGLAVTKRQIEAESVFELELGRQAV
jgi:hypothetical protein